MESTKELMAKALLDDIVSRKSTDKELVKLLLDYVIDSKITNVGLCWWINSLNKVNKISDDESRRLRSIIHSQTIPITSSLYWSVVYKHNVGDRCVLWWYANWLGKRQRIKFLKRILKSM